MCDQYLFTFFPWQSSFHCFFGLVFILDFEPMKVVPKCFWICKDATCKDEHKNFNHWSSECGLNPKQLNGNNDKNSLTNFSSHTDKLCRCRCRNSIYLEENLLYWKQAYPVVNFQTSVTINFKLKTSPCTYAKTWTNYIKSPNTSINIQVDRLKVR